MSPAPGQPVTVRLRCGRCRRVLARLPWRAARWSWVDGAVAEPHHARCRCGAKPSISPAGLATAATKARNAGVRDLYTDLPRYGLPATLR